MGLSQDQWKLVEPCGWVAATLMMPQTEKRMTATYSMMSRTHWKLVVQRMPQMQMKVIRASQMPATTAWLPMSEADAAEIQPHCCISCSV